MKINFENTSLQVHARCSSIIILFSGFNNFWMRPLLKHCTMIMNCDSWAPQIILDDPLSKSSFLGHHALQSSIHSFYDFLLII
jgi:hypothetical protein